MKDFDYQATTGRSIQDIIKINLIGRKYNLIEAWETYTKQKAEGAQASVSHIASRTASLFAEWQGTLKRTIKEEEYNLLKEACRRSKKAEELEKCFDILSEHMDKLQITRIDTQKIIDRSNIEESNKEHGY